MNRIMNSWGAISQKFHVPDFFAAITQKFKDLMRTVYFTFRIALYEQIFSFLSAKLFELRLQIDFF